MITFPTDAIPGQEFVATNGATYVWLGNRWNSTTAIFNRTAAYIEEGGDAYTWDDPENYAYDNTLDGGLSQ
jgi:hypothetical protein